MLEISAAILVLLAGLLHGYIFILESFRWTKQSTMDLFSISTRDEAEATREMAFNQGFYNLFLGVTAVIGSVTYLSGIHTVGLTLMFAGTTPMVGAAVVLLVGSPDKRAAALKQMALPLLGCMALLISMLP
ncbi:MAG: DUF1304 domain-containing protein [Bifidobacterium crudilactis]|jgi:putative membrane protein|uniref:DUF1304 domain-containing protein n=1 Tax=Bifidobacterium crudilactis TaxID=327277 RepID=UPI003A5B96B8